MIIKKIVKSTRVGNTNFAIIIPKIFTESLKFEVGEKFELQLDLKKREIIVKPVSASEIQD